MAQPDPAPPPVTGRVVLASSNEGKLRELAALLEPRGFQLVLQSELGIEAPEETGNTFEDNALLKARHAAQLSGLPALADDSGIEVDALDGRPGVWSARYAGESATDLENLELMLTELADVPDARRTARYRCVIALVRSAEDPEPLLGSGVWEGHIATFPRGSGGFGYDPIFLPDGQNGRSAAEMSTQAKNAVSHRARALHALLEQLGGPPTP
ncbi:MAG: RdgB/HAM1 family non-canonical purine NTP pyrophosphatase [Steroidobacteraceae bacterium]